MAKELFACFERGEWARTRRLFAAGAQIRSQYGRGAPSVQDYEGFLKSATTPGGALQQLGLPVYSDRRVTLLGNGNGFVEQHITRLVIGGQRVEFPVCIVVKCNPKGEIELLEEYLDTGLLAKAFMQKRKSAKL